MANFAAYTSWSSDELRNLYFNQNDLNIANQPETWAILGRSISTLKLFNKVVNEPVSLSLYNEFIYLKITIDDNRDITYKIDLPYIEVKLLEENEINLMEYLKGCEFALEIGEERYIQEYASGTLSQEYAMLFKQYMPNVYNMLSLGVLVNQFSDNEIVFSAGYVMIFDLSVDKQALWNIGLSIPRVTKLLVDYHNEEQLQSYLVSKIEEEILKNNLKISEDVN